MMRTALFGLFAAAGFALTANTASAQVIYGPTYNPYGVVTSSYYTSPGVSVVTPVGGVYYGTTPYYSGWWSGYGYRPYTYGSYYRSGYYPYYGSRYYGGYRGGWGWRGRRW